MKAAFMGGIRPAFMVLSPIKGLRGVFGSNIYQLWLFTKKDNKK
jgi:hypothetical protein